MITTSSDRRRVRAGVNNVRDRLEDASSLLQDATRRAGDEADAKLDDAESALRSAMQRIQTLKEQAADRASAAIGATDGFVKAHPWQMVGVGAAVGFLIAAALSLNRR
jgi:ElaB protein